jgi:hypothetical protein
MTPAQFWAIESQNQQNKIQRMDDLADKVGSGAGRLASAAVGFATGGPAGAAMAMANGGEGGMLGNIIGSYAQKEQDKSDSKIYGNLMKIVAPSFGKDGDSMLEQWNSLESDRDRARFGSTLFSSLGQISNMYMANRNAGIRENAPILNAGLQGAERVAGGEGTVPLPEEPPLPTKDDSTLPPVQPRQPSPDVMSAADSWYNQSNRGMMQTGTMKPFYRK